MLEPRARNARGQRSFLALFAEAAVLSLRLSRMAIIFIHMGYDEAQQVHAGFLVSTGDETRPRIILRSPLNLDGPVESRAADKVILMAGTKFDPRVDDLVVETKTLWDDSVGELSSSDKASISKAIHASPELASKIEYDRAHTGFTRIITVTVEDIQRLYQQRVATGP